VERKWKERYKQKFRRRAVARMNACENITRLSRELGVSRGCAVHVAIPTGATGRASRRYSVDTEFPRVQAS